jgi:hypothetical protein
MLYPDLIAVAAVVGAAATVAVTFRWFRHREHLATLSATQGPPGALDGAVDARLRRLEAQVERVTEAVDAVAVEVERVGEGQRFLAAQLADRVPAPAPPPAVHAGGRVVTPH